ncbi:SRPBCC family protein, partial [Escherichia sp. TWPC-MK]
KSLDHIRRQLFKHATKGEFKKLIGGWKFTPLSQEACRIEFHLDFEFTNKLIELAFGRVFKELASNMVQAFTVRAKEVYSAR